MIDDLFGADPDDFDDEPGSGWDLFLSLAVRHLVKGVPAPKLLDWAAEHGPDLLSALGAGADGRPDPRNPFTSLPHQEQARLLRLVAWQVAKVLPLPDQHFKPVPLAMPGRNDPCLCGSPQKFKHCCAPIMTDMPQIVMESLAPHLFDAMLRKDWKTLPAHQVPAMWVLAAVAFWLGLDSGEPDPFGRASEGRLKDALALLEPWAELPGPWPDKHAPLYDLLGDVCLELDKPRKRKALAERMVERGAPRVQAMGWQRLALLATDAGKEKEALAALQRALQLAPDDPRTALFEVTLLSGQGRDALARERAAFHARRLDKLPPTPELRDAVKYLEQIAQAGLGAFMAEAVPDDSIYGRLAHWLAGLPAPVPALDLSGATDQDLYVLTPDKAARQALQRWATVFDPELPQLNQLDAPESLEMDFAHEWLPVLEDTPVLGQCLDVLDGLVLVLQQQDHPAALALVERLLVRAIALWAVLRQRYPNAACAWAVPDNRPALRLIAQYIESDPTPSAERAFEMLAYLVRVLNPNDNQGYRERLAAVYLRRKQVAEALALCERYPQDRPGMGLLHSLALQQAGCTAQAVDVARASLADNTHLTRLLKGKKPPPEVRTVWIKLGSADEAKVIVHEQFDLWQGAEAHALLRAVGA